METLLLFFLIVALAMFLVISLVFIVLLIFSIVEYNKIKHFKERR
jgi:hypothetical protein